MPESVPTILLVESDLFFSARILSVLKKSGYGARSATTPDQALALLKSARPALAIVSLNDPRLSSLDLIRHLRATEGAPPVLAYLSHVRIPALREEALAAGVDKLVPNSAISLRLVTILEEVLGGGIKEPVEDEEKAPGEDSGRSSVVRGPSSDIGHRTLDVGHSQP